MSVDVEHRFSYHAPSEKARHRLENMRREFKVLAEMIQNVTYPGDDQDDVLKALHATSMQVNYLIIANE